MPLGVGGAMTMTHCDKQFCLQAHLIPFAFLQALLRLICVRAHHSLDRYLLNNLLDWGYWLILHWLYTRLSSRVRKTQGKTEHTQLVHTNRIFSYHRPPRLICFQCGGTVEPVVLSLPAEQHRKGKPNQVKANIALPKFPQSFFLSGMSKLWQIKQLSRCVILKLKPLVALSCRVCRQ